MANKNSTYYIEPQSIGSSSSTKSVKKKKTSLETQVETLELKVIHLVEKTEYSVTSKKWLLGTTISISGIILVVLTIVASYFNGYINTQRQYYQDLIEVRESLIKSTTCSKFSSFWEFKNCLAN
jgi:hypothetical protein